MILNSSNKNKTTSSKLNEESSPKNFLNSINISKEIQKVAIEVWGCQMNVADGEAMLKQFITHGYEFTSDVTNADVIIFHTCNIREKAKHKIESRLGSLKYLKKKRKVTFIVTGCVVQAEGITFCNQIPYVDIFIGSGKIDRIYDLFLDHIKYDKKIIELGFDSIPCKTEKSYSNINTNINTNININININTITNISNKTNENKSLINKNDIFFPTLTGKNEISRFVNIVQGCNNFCTYCTVPFARGTQRTIPEDIILNNVNDLVLSGAKEITLLGQNVNSYGLDNLQDRKENEGKLLPFCALIDKVVSYPIDRLRFTTSNPYDFCIDIVNRFATIEKLGRYIHLPLQSGSNDVLLRMNRKITIEKYIEKISWLKNLDENFAISTDFIVGFPGETDEDFERTCDCIKQIGFSFAFAFKYSPRTGTKASKYLDQIDESIKEKRLAKLNEIQDKITIEKNKSYEGKTVKVLFTYESEKEKGVYYGRDDYFRLVRVHSTTNIVGKLLGVEIDSANKTALSGKCL